MIFYKAIKYKIFEMCLDVLLHKLVINAMNPLRCSDIREGMYFSKIIGPGFGLDMGSFVMKKAVIMEYMRDGKSIIIGFLDKDSNISDKFYLKIDENYDWWSFIE